MSSFTNQDSMDNHRWQVKFDFVSIIVLEKQRFVVNSFDMIQSEVYIDTNTTIHLITSTHHV
jgi:hypothetical protein